MGNMGCTVRKPPFIIFFDSKHWRDNFESSRKTDKLMVVHFGTPQNGPCQQMEAIFYGLAVRYRDIQFSQVHFDRLNDVAIEFEIKAIPTIVLIRSGKEVQRVVGTTSREELEKLIEKHKG